MLLFSACQFSALICMHMADERTPIPSNLTAHIAPSVVGSEIGILVIVGILSPKNDGIVRLSLFGLPLGHIGRITFNSDRI